MILKDDRTEEQKKTHVWGVVGTDPFMSGWGEAKDGASYAVWATTAGNVASVEREVLNRGDMHRVRVVYLPDYRPRFAAHVHIYVRT